MERLAFVLRLSDLFEEVDSPWGDAGRSRLYAPGTFDLDRWVYSHGHGVRWAAGMIKVRLLAVPG